MSGRACTKRQYTTKCPFVGTFKPNQAENPSGQGFGALYHPARGPASLNRSRRGGRRLSPPRSVGRSERGTRAARWGGRRAERAQPGGEVSPPRSAGRSARGARAARWGGFASPRSGEVGARSAPGGDVHLPTPRVAG